MAERVIVWVYDNDTKKSFLICSTMSDNIALFDFLFDLKLSITTSQQSEWEYYLDYPTDKIVAFLVENKDDVNSVMAIILKSRNLE
jgi:hypothetical protein